MFTCAFPRMSRGGGPRSVASAGYRRHLFLILNLYFTSFQWPDIMAYANNNLSVQTFADSYMKWRYFRTDRYKGNDNHNLLCLEPHVILDLGNNTEIKEVKFYNNAIGGNTMDRILRDTVNIGIWSNNLPKVTLFHVGACDISALDIGRNPNIRNVFYHHVSNFLTQFKAIGRESYESDKAKFDSDLKSHVFLYTGVPDWGKFGKGRPGCLTEDQFFTARRNANRGINKCRSGLWTEHRAVLFTPRIVNSDEEPAVRNFNLGDVHLYGHSATEYGNQICNVLAKLLCTYCQLSPSYIKEEHSTENLLGPCKKCQPGAGTSAQ